jgi:hypothetical protein
MSNGNNDHAMETYRSLVTISIEALKIFVLLNGGAIVALLAYLGQVDARVELAWLVAQPLRAFVVGLVLGALGFVGSYLTQLSLYNESAHGKPQRHHHFLWATVILGLTSIAAFACGAFATIAAFGKPASDLVTPHRALWNASGISNYEYSIVQSAYSPEAPPMHVVVRAGAVQSATLLCLPPSTEDTCRKWAEAWKDIYGPDKLPTYAKTIPQLFDRISTMRADPYDRDAWVLALFDPTYGFPTRFSFDNPKTSDDEYSFQVLDFTVIQ